MGKIRNIAVVTGWIAEGDPEAEGCLWELDGVTLLARAVRKCRAADCFDAVWVAGRGTEIEAVATAENCGFFPCEEGGDWLREFMEAHECQRIFTVSPSTPLFTGVQVCDFTAYMNWTDFDTLVPCVQEAAPCMHQDQPVNFRMDAAFAGQEMSQVQRVVQGITGWRCEAYLTAETRGAWCGKVGFYPVDMLAGCAISTQADLAMAAALLPLRG